MSKKMLLFIYTLLFLSIGATVFFHFDRYGAKKQKNHDNHVIQNAASLINKYNSIKRQDKVDKADLSADQDLTVAVMNLIGIEEHLFFTGAKTQKTEYYDLINEVREIRKALLKKLIPNYEGEVWCISKHLLAASYRLMETGTKQLNLGNKQEAYALFDQAYKLYLMFWKINIQHPLDNNNQTTKLQFDPEGVNGANFEKTNLQHSKTNTGIPTGKACVFDGSKINCCNE
jgi:hypothetical protein